MPTASAAMPTRPLSSTLIMMWKPRPSVAEQRIRRQLDAVEMERAHRRGALAHLVLLAAAR